MKKRANIILFLVLIVFAFQGCGEKEPITIGVVGTMTGNQSDLSVSGRRGIEIAVEEVNSSGGINGRLIKLVVKDDMNDPNRAKAIVGEFVDEGIKIVIGHYTSGMMLAAYDDVIKNDILYLGPTISADNLSQIDDNFIRFIASTKEQAKIITEVAINTGEKEFLVIIDKKNIGFNQSLYDNFNELLLKNGGSIQGTFDFEELDQQTMDEIQEFVMTNKQIKNLFVIANANDLATIVQEIRKSGNEISIYGPLWSHTEDLLRVGGEFVEGTKVVSAIDNESESKLYLNFSKAYYERYGRDASFSSIYSYETCMALVKSLQETTEITPINIKNSIINIGSFDGLQQSFQIDEFGDNTRQYMMDQIIKGSFIRID